VTARFEDASDLRERAIEVEPVERLCRDHDVVAIRSERQVLGRGRDGADLGQVA
jgi:hypothetical protein